MHVSSSSASILHFRSNKGLERGKIAEDWANFDDLGLMHQLGAILELGEQTES
jgi:hypothetical protein